MQNIILSYPNRIDSATISGGSWLSALPAQNLANRELWKVARSTDASLASTKFSVDLGEDRLLRCFALANHNLSAEARWLVKVFGEDGPVNLCLYSEQFDESYWVYTRSSVIPNSATAPDGTMTADRLVEDLSAGSHYTRTSSISIEAGEEYTASIYFKPETRDSIVFRLLDYTTALNGASLVYNTSSGVITPSVNGSGTLLSSSVKTVGDGWVRISISAIINSTETSIRLWIYPASDGLQSYTGDGASGIYVWGAQLEAASSPTTYKPTTSSPSNIALLYSSQWQDVWQMAFDNLAEWGSAAWWTGTAGDEYYRSPYHAMLAMPDFITARYVTVEIDDTANVGGYVQVGRLFAGGGIQPETNASYGLQDSWRDLSTMDASESGSAWATERRRLRGVSFVIERLTLAEAAYIHEMQRLLGTVNEVLYLPYPDNLGESQRYGFIGRLSELSAIEYPYYKRRSNAFKIEEIG